MINDERAYPYAWNGQATWGFTKGELATLKIAAAIVQGLYAGQGGLGKTTEADIVKQAESITKVLCKKV